MYQLYRYYNFQTGDYFYATDDADRQRALGGGYVDESSYDTIYVLPYSQNIQNILTARLYRLFHPDLNYYLFCVSVQQQQEVQEWVNTEEQAYANA